MIAARRAAQSLLLLLIIQCTVTHSCASKRRLFLSIRRTTSGTTSLPLAMALPRPFDIIQRDFAALTRRVTAHHILLPKSDQVALSLKQKIRNSVNPPSTIRTINNDDDNDGDETEQTKPMYIVDAFMAAAEKYSRDEETAMRGGLLGNLAPQGYCRAPELDKACFEVPLGQVAGPIESDYGYHLLLVVERTNCPKLDGGFSKIERGGADGTETAFVGKNLGRDINGGDTEDILKLALQQVGFWIAVSFAGGIVAELAANAANVMETLPWQ